MSGRRVVLITGTRKGIGRHLAEHYLARGDCVIGCSRQDCDLEHPEYHHIVLDIGDEARVRAMFRQVRDAHGRLDALINNAGIAAMNHSLLTPLATARRVLDTNVLGTFLLCREAARVMKGSAGGRIINFVTVAVPLKLAGEAVYAASKAAVLSLTQVLAHEFAPFGITVNAVGPTPIRTDLISGVPGEKLDALLRRQAIPRFGEPRDVANVIDFFLRPESDFVTGQVIYLGGV